MNNKTRDFANLVKMIETKNNKGRDVMKNAELRKIAKEVHDKEFKSITNMSAFRLLVDICVSVVFFAGIFVAPFVDYYFSSFFLDTARNQYKRFPSPDERTSEKMGHIFLTYVLIFVAFLIGLSLFIVPGLIVGVCMTQIGFVLKDYKELSAFSVLRTTWISMRGLKFQAFKIIARFKLECAMVFIVPLFMVFTLSSAVINSPLFSGVAGLLIIALVILAVAIYLFLIVPRYQLTIALFFNHNVKPKIDELLGAK